MRIVYVSTDYVVLCRISQNYNEVHARKEDYTEEEENACDMRVNVNAEMMYKVQEYSEKYKDCDACYVHAER